MRFEIDHQFKLGRLLHGQVRRLGPFQDSPGVDASLPYRFGLNRSVADQAAIPDILAKCVDGRNAVASCERDQLVAAIKKIVSVPSSNARTPCRARAVKAASNSFSLLAYAICIGCPSDRDAASTSFSWVSAS